MARKPRDAFVLSSKVGKLLTASRDNEGRKHFPFSPSLNTPHFDYTGDGVRRSIEDSLQRLGLDRLDIVFVHDLSPDNKLLPDDWETLFRDAEKGAFPTLSRMRDEGLIDGWGMGLNTPQPILRCLEVADSESTCSPASIPLSITPMRSIMCSRRRATRVSASSSARR